jgi:predicted nucleic acid-binding protein
MASAGDRLVLDASIAFKWHLADEEHTDLAQALLVTYLTGDVGLVAPTHIHYEVFNALMVASRLRTPRLSQQAAIEATEEFLELRIPTITDDDLLRAARSVAYEYGCAFYDGLYLALAERLNLPLITADRKCYDLIASHPLALWITDYAQGGEPA